MRLFVISLLLVVLTVPVWAQDPGQPDSLYADSVGIVGGKASVNLTLVNDQPMSGIQIPIEYSGDLVTLDSVSFGSRAQFGGAADIVRWDQNLGGSNQTVMIAIVPLETGAIATGNDVIATLHFTENPSALANVSVIRSTTLTPAGGLLAGDVSVPSNGYVPVFDSGTVSKPTAVGEDGLFLPDDYDLLPNYPNPFNPTTAMTVALPKPSHVVLDIFNLLGQKVRRVFDGPAPAGYLHLQWDGRDEKGRPVGSGVYFYRVDAGDYQQVRKMVLLK